MPEKYKNLLKSLAKNSLFIDYLKYLEDKYSDIRTLDNYSEESIKTRVEALKLLRENLLGKLLILSGEEEPPSGDEYK